MNKRPSIDVQRRRRGEKPVGRAEAPVRPGGGGAPSGSGSMGGGGSGGFPRPAGGVSLPSGGKLGGCGGVLLVVVVVAIYLLSGGLGGGGDPTDVGTLPELTDEPGPVAQNFPTNTPRPTRTPAPVQTGQQGDTWLVMLYQDADDQILEQDIFLDLNEAELVGSSEQVTIVAQLDRYRGAFTGNEDWNSTRRYLITQDNNLDAIQSELVADLGEVNMADGSSLVDFATWAIATYPADRYALILSDHGMGWPGGWSDPTATRGGGSNAPLSSALGGDFLWLAEIDAALGEIRSQTGLDKFDAIGMDACLMSQMEVYAALQPHARYAAASEEVEPALGWAYTAFLEELVANPGMGTDQLLARVVETYVEEDQRILDDQARADFLRQGSPMGGFFSVRDVDPEVLAGQLGKNATLTAVNLEALSDLIAAYNQFAYTLQDEDQSLVAGARSYSQSYTSVFGKNAPPSYIDLGHFVQLVAKNSNRSQVDQAAGQVLDALGSVVVAEKHGPARNGSTGIAIYYPNSTMYSSPYTGPQSYNALAERFVQVSLWDDFLAYHYHDRPFDLSDAAAVAPSAGSVSRAPGAGEIAVSDVTSSAESLAPGETVNVQATISGNNIGYIYLFIGLHDEQSNAIYVADTDYLESADTQQVGGVFYPVWPESDAFDINFEWDASLFSISDGTSSALALLNPQAYGASPEDAVYVVNGTYTFAGSGEQVYAQLQFIDGRLNQVFGFQGQDDSGSPREITPAAGDTFTISQKWMELDASGKVSQVVYEDGETLTFSGAPFVWEVVYAPAGDYLVGFLVSDLDGNMTEGYTVINVR